MRACQGRFPLALSPRHEAALAYARANIPVFPCVPNGKQPATSFGFKDATTDEATIDFWWQHHDYNVAIVPESAGWCVVDIDPEGLAWYEANRDRFPTTYTVRTPRGGLHLYYAGSLPPTASKLAPGVDTRGVGSYVLVPPSVVDGKSYVREH